MLFINHLEPNVWWQLDKERMMAFNYRGGHNYVTEEDIKNSDVVEYDSWHELYLAKHFCPIETEVWFRDVWISPEGKFYDGEAHLVMAEYLCDIIYGQEDIFCADDYLEERGWIKATTSFMWELRFESLCNREFPQKQYDALFDWCECHKKAFPTNITIK